MKNPRRLVFSVYSHDLEDYPYFPFVAANVSDGIKKFRKFLSSKSSICPGAELHIIGTCEVYSDFPDDNNVENIQPLIMPQRVVFKRSLFGRTVAKTVFLGSFYLDKILQFIVTFMKGSNDGKSRK